MKILMVCAEYAPYAKTGGLADAVTGLAEALAARGHDVSVLLPRYAHVPAGEAAETIDGREISLCRARSAREGTARLLARAPRARFGRHLYRTTTAKRADS